MAKIKLPLAILGNRSFLYLWLAQVFSQVAGNLLNFALLFRIAQLTNSNTIDSLFIIAISLPAFFFGSVAGVYVERSKKKNVLFFCNLLRVAAVLSFGLGGETIIWIFLLAILISIITQFFVPAEASLIPKYVKDELLLQANGLFTLTFYSSVIVGFMLAGPLLVILGIQNVLLFCAILFFIATILVSALPGVNSWESLKNLLLKRQSLAKPHALWPLITKIGVDLKEGYQYVKKNPRVFEAIFIMAWVQILIATMAAISPGYAATVLKLEITDASLYIVGPAVLGMLVGSLLVGVMGTNRKINQIITAGVIFSGIFLTILSFLSRGKYSHIFASSNNLLGFDILHLAIFFLFALGFSSALVTVCANTILQESEERVRSRVYGFLTAVSGIGAVFPVLAAGILSDLAGVVKVMLGLGLGILTFGTLRIIRK